MPAELISTDDVFKYETFLFDADGVLWTGDRPVPGAQDFITTLLKKGKRVFIITNNSTKTVDEYMKKIEKMGFGNVNREHVMSPAVVLADHLQSKQFQGKRVYLIGTNSLKNSLESAGVHCFGTGPDPFDQHTSGDFMFGLDCGETPAAVVVSFDGHFSYPKLMRAANYISHPECEFFITNEDYQFPGPDKSLVVPGTGCIAACVRSVTDRRPTVFGKPGTKMGDFLKKRHHIDPASTIMFGDRLDTDIHFANSNGFASCLVLTGVNNHETVARAEEDGKQYLVPRFYYSFLQ